MHNPLERRYGEGDLHFITFSCIQRRPLLVNAPARDCFLRVLAEIRDRYEFHMIGYLVMAGHVHLLLTEPIKGNPSKVLQVLKQLTSRKLLPKDRDADLSGEQHF